LLLFEKKNHHHDSDVDDRVYNPLAFFIKCYK
jgi:hypothetical protein